MKRAVITRAVVLALGLALVPASASAWCRMTTSDREPSPSEPCIFPDPTVNPETGYAEYYLEWRNPCSQMTLSEVAMSDDISESSVRGALDRAITTWESQTCAGQPVGVDIQLIGDYSTCEAPLFRDDNANVNTLMFSYDWADRRYDPAAFAVTTVWFRKSTGEILDVDMEVNERRGPYAICPDEGCTDGNTVDLENVLTHEMGHYLGMAHSTDPEATMFASSIAGETIKRDLSEDDRLGLCTIYPPGRPDGVCEYAPRGGQRLDCQNGCSVSAPGRAPGPATALPLLAMGLLLVLRRRRTR